MNESMYFLLNMDFFHCYVKFWECKILLFEKNGTLQIGYTSGLFCSDFFLRTRGRCVEMHRARTKKNPPLAKRTEAKPIHIQTKMQFAACRDICDAHLRFFKRISEDLTLRMPCIFGM